MPVCLEIMRDLGVDVQSPLIKHLGPKYQGGLATSSKEWALAEHLATVPVCLEIMRDLGVDVQSPLIKHLGPKYQGRQGRALKSQVRSLENTVENSFGLNPKS